MKVLDLTGKRFGKLFVIERSGTSEDGQKIYLCRCDCGNNVNVKSNNLRNGHTTSCGCYNREQIIKRNQSRTKHGERWTRLYLIWRDMKSRCSYKNSINWHLYGGRGIKVCDEWNNDYVAFRNWALSNGYEDELQLDRIDNNGNYEPENCKWSTRKEQGNNRRTCKYITIDGVTKTVSEWCEITGVSRYTAYSRIDKGMNPEQAVTQKPRVKLTEEQARDIKHNYNPKDKKCNAQAFMDKYHVSRSTIESIVGGHNWKQID